METWATFDFFLDLSGPGGLRSRLTRSLREAIRTARLAPGTRLPSSRALASDLGIARNTVAAAYDELVAEGWLTARRGSGTRVAQRVTPAPPVRRAPADQPLLDLTPSTPDIGLFPRAAWIRSTRRALTAAPSDAFGPGDPRGRIELRTALAEYLGRSRGVRADPERIVIVSGTAHSLRILGQLLPGPFAVESYGLDFHRDLLGTKTVPVMVDDAGARTEELPSVPAALLTPAHQFPLGGPLHPWRRAAAVEWARSEGALVLEDDYDGEFRYDRDPVGAVQGLDPEHVVYLGTASKSLAPAMRMGWMVLPDHLVDAVVESKGEREQWSSAMEQLTMADFLESGGYDAHVRRMRAHYRKRRDQLIAALEPHLHVPGIPAGLHVVLELTEGCEDGVLDAALAEGIGIRGLTEFRHPDVPRDRDGVVLSFGAPAFPRALPGLRRVLAQYG